MLPKGDAATVPGGVLAAGRPAGGGALAASHTGR